MNSNNFESTKEGLGKSIEKLKRAIFQFQEEKAKLIERSELSTGERSELDAWLSGEIGMLASLLEDQAGQEVPGTMLLDWRPSQIRVQGNMVNLQGSLNGSFGDLVKRLSGEETDEAGTLQDWRTRRRNEMSGSGSRPLEAGSIGDWDVGGLILRPNFGKDIQDTGDLE